MKKTKLVHLTHLFQLIALVSSTCIFSSAFADGPCGNGHYVYRCFPARCGEPSRCTMVCDGPSDSATNVSELVEVQVSNNQIDSDGNETVQMPHSIEIMNMCK